MWVCAICGAIIKPNKDNEPESHYWKGLHIEEVYCSAEHSLEAYQKEVNKDGHR